MIQQQAVMLNGILLPTSCRLSQRLPCAKPQRYHVCFGISPRILLFLKDIAMITPLRRTNVRTFLFIACVLAGSVPLAQAATWCWGTNQIQGNGNVARQQRELGHFTGVGNSLAAKVEIRIGDKEGVTIETDENLLPLIETVIEDGMLTIQPLKRNQNLCSKSIKIIVQARSLDHITLGGSGSIDSDALRARKLQVDLGGSGTINLKGVEADTLAVNLGGSGDLNAAGGAAKNVSISIGGSGNVKMGNVRSNNVSVSIAGSGQATVWARDALSLTVAGSGDVNYYGDPRVTTSVLGSGSTRRLAAAPPSAPQ